MQRRTAAVTLVTGHLPRQTLRLKEVCILGLQVSSISVYDDGHGLLAIFFRVKSLDLQLSLVAIIAIVDSSVHSE